MGGFVDPFIPSPAWPQDMVFPGSSWAGLSAQGMGFHHLQNGSSPTQLITDKELAAATVFPAGNNAKLHDHEQQLLLRSTDDLDYTLCSILGGQNVSLTDSAPVLCSSSNESSGSEQSGAAGVLPQFLMGERHPVPVAWASGYAGEETPQSFGFPGDDLLHEAAPNGYQQLGTVAPAQLQLHDDAKFSAGKLLSFAPGQQQIRPDIDTLQQEFGSGLRHLNLVPGAQLAPFNPKQCAEDGRNGNGVAFGGGAPKARVRARRGQATDPHSIAERLRREKISDRMKNLQELVPNSNKTDKASMLEEIIEYIKFLQLQTKVLSMSRLGATDALVPLLMDSHNESSGLVMGSPKSGAAAGGKGHAGDRQTDSDDFVEDKVVLEQEVAQMMEDNMTMAMQYLQNRGLCLMPITLASAISVQKGTFSATVRPENGGKDDVKRVPTVLPSQKEVKSRPNVA